MPFPNLRHPISRIPWDDDRVDILCRRIIRRVFKEVPVDRSVAGDDIVQRLGMDLVGKPCRGDGDDAFDVDVVRVQEQTDLRSERLVDTNSG